MKAGKLLFVATAIAVSSFAAIAQNQQVYDTIPFEIVQDKFIFSASIDGKPVKLILDTGGQNIIVADSVEHFGVNIVSSHTIADVNDAKMNVKLGSVKNLKIGKRMNWDMGKMTVVPNNRFFRELGVAGAVGGEAFAKVCLSIDRRNKRFTISYPYRPDKIPRSEGTAMEMGRTFHAVVPVAIGNTSVKVLFDSGMSGFLSLGSDDYERINAHAGDVEKQSAGYGLLYVGVSGVKNAIRDSIYKVRIPEMKLPGGKIFHNLGTLVGQHSSTIAGQKLFDYGIVMLDYPRGLFYFFPHDKAPSDVETETKLWNVRILPVVDHFEIVAAIGDTDFKIGERVWSINDVELSTMNLSETVIENLLDGISADISWITVGSDEKHLRKVSIKKI